MYAPVQAVHGLEQRQRGDHQHLLKEVMMIVIMTNINTNINNGSVNDNASDINNDRDSDDDNDRNKYSDNTYVSDNMILVTALSPKDDFWLDLDFGLWLVNCYIINRKGMIAYAYFYLYCTQLI